MQKFDALQLIEVGYARLPPQFSPKYFLNILVIFVKEK